jgi:hypothetical protein
VKRRLGLVVALLLGAAWSMPAQEPSLAELAAREKARRKAAKKANPETRTFTEEDLASAKGEGVSTPGAEQAPVVQTRPMPQLTTAPPERSGGGREGGDGREGVGEGGERDNAGQDRGGWAQRASALRERIAAAEARVPALERQIEELRLDNAPNPPDLLDPNRLQKRAAAIDDLRRQVEAARNEAEQLRREYAELEEAARRAGVRPGDLEGRD